MGVWLCAGSNAFLLSSDLATLFTGRHVELHVFPFSFSEYAEYHGKGVDAPGLLDEYVRRGGLAGSYNYRNEADADGYVRDVYRTIITRDLVQKYNLPDTQVLERLAEFMMDNVGNLYQKEVDFVARAPLPCGNINGWQRPLWSLQRV